MAKVLLVDDDLTMVQMVAELLRQEGHEVFPFSNGSAAVAGLTAHSPDVVITDLYFDKTRAHGLEVVQKARALSPPAVVIVITGFGTIETAVEAMKNGAFDYLEKPFKVEELKLCVQRALSYNAAVTETAYLRKQLKKKYEFSQIIGNAPKMQEVFKLIERVADTDSTILVLGESGTGKELVARALHYNSRRQFAPFVPVNCSALPENLLESELFGHRRGSFTGAISDKKGLFEEADSGTIFLDEVGSMSAMLQSRLLRVLQEREVRRVGENTPIYVNVRVVAASNEPLEKRITGRHLSRGPLLPAQRDRHSAAELAGAAGRYSAAGGAFPQAQGERRHEPAGPGHPPGDGTPVRSRLAGKCAGTGKRHRAGGRRCAMATLFGREICRRACLASVKTTSPALDARGCRDLAGGAGIRAVSAAFGARARRRSGGGAAGQTEPLLPMKAFLREQELAHLNRAIQQCGGDKEQAALLLGMSVATMYRRLSAEDKES